MPRLPPVVRGSLTFVPFLGTQMERRRHRRRKGGSQSARYCYAVWFRHLAAVSGIAGFRLGHVAEIGPGSSLGIGLAALLCGASRYTALDVVAHANLDTNESVLDELVRLLEEDVPVPTQDEFPRVVPRLDSLRSPSDILSGIGAISSDGFGARVEQLRFSLKHPGHPDSLIEYCVPWHDARCIRTQSVDFLFSQAVLEHIDDVVGTYRACALWLRPGRIMSHAIDFDSHGLAASWDGHWRYPDFTWQLVRGRRHYLINRLPLAAHLSELQWSDFEILAVERSECSPTYAAGLLAPRFRDMCEPDRKTRSAFLVARRRPS